MSTRLVCALLLISSAAWSASGLTYSTYLREGFAPAAITADTAGNVYVAGSTANSATVVKINPAGSQYLYVRNFGGSVSDAAAAIAVDAAGNAYVTGTTPSPDFPITAGGHTGTLPAAGQTRAFLIKFDPQGETVFSAVLGSVTTTGLAVMVTPAGQIIVSGVSGVGLAATQNAYSVPDTTGRPFLMEIDPTGSTLVVVATGIGGNALGQDATGNIYMAGGTIYTDYPTTPGAYQTVLSPVYLPCPLGTCMIDIAGTNQYVTKVDSAATKLIFSTGMSQSTTTNGGMAVDAAGNVYLTGLTYGAYGWTVLPANADMVNPFITRLDLTGSRISYSIPVGGAGIVLGPQGDVYLGGTYNDAFSNILAKTTTLPPPPRGVTNPPAPCQVNYITTVSQGYIAHLDAVTGDVLSSVLFDGTNVTPTGIALAANSTVWLAGGTSQADTPISQGAITPTSLAAGTLPGAFLGAAGFNVNQPPAGPQIGCIVDGGNQSRAGVVAPNQLLALIGTGLGPATPMSATDNSTTLLGGVSVTFDGVAAPILYVSSTQVNFAVPAGVLLNGSAVDRYSTMQVSVNGVPSAPREIPLAASVPGLFGDLSSGAAFALNGDGSINSQANPAKPGTTLSFFMNGLGAATSTVAVTMGKWSAEVVNISAPNPFVSRFDVAVPAAAIPNFETSFMVFMDVSLSGGFVPVSSPLVQVGGFSVWVSP